MPATPISNDILGTAEAAARAIPEVTAVGILVRHRASRPPGGPPALVPAVPRRAGSTIVVRDRRPALVSGPPLVLPESFPRTLGEGLRQAARTAGDRGTSYLLDDGSVDRQSYRRLLDDAARLLPGLRATGLEPGDPVILQFENSRHFVTAFWACLLGGFVSTPIGPAPGYRRHNAVTGRIRDAWELLDRPPVLTDLSMLSRLQGLRGLWGTEELRFATVEELRADAPATDLYQARPDDPAFHLLTSGSSGVPKCVRHTHRSVISRSFANAEANRFDSQDVTLNWMPLDHVGGMPMHNLRDVLLTCEHVNVRTDGFVENPLRWLDWIERFAVTNTWAPNFAFSMINSRVDEIARGRWDLSALRDISNGGEPVVSSVAHEFVRLLEPHGMRPDVMRPAWGMSETCAGVTHSTLHRDDEAEGVVTVDKFTLEGGDLELLSGPSPGQPSFTVLGPPVRGMSLRIVDAGNEVQSQDRVGRLQVRGAALMAGYHNNPSANREAFTRDGWFDTGDLAFIHDGQLVLTGRGKDQIIIRGANYPCHEIETAVTAVDGVLPTFAAACGEYDQDAGTDRLVVFCVIETPDAASRRDTAHAIAARLARDVGLVPYRVVPVPREDFPKTESGKIQRARLMARYQAGDFDQQLALLAQEGAPDVPRTVLAMFTTVYVPTGPVAASGPAGTWLVIADDDRLAARLRALRPAGGGAVVAVTPSELRELRASVRHKQGEVTAVVHALSVGHGAVHPDPEVRLERSVDSVHELIRAFAQEDVRLVVLTTGGLQVTGEEATDPVKGALAGLIRTANAERGVRWVRQVDVAPGEPDMAGPLLTELGDASGAEIVARRGGLRFTPRLRPVDGIESAPGTGIREGGLYLVTGGLGGLGVRLAAHLLATYGARLVLLGRSALTTATRAELDDLALLGEVTYQAVDVADSGALRAAVLAAERCGRTLDGAFHLAAADLSGYWADVESHVLSVETAAEFRRLFRPKILGTLALAEVLRDRPDALLVLFSSVNGYFGGYGFGAYSAANGFLSAFAEQRREGGPTVRCLAWSMWSGAGMNRARAANAAARGRGFLEIDPDAGIGLIDAALTSPYPSLYIGLDDGNENVARELDPSAPGPVSLTVAYLADSPVAEREVRAAVEAALDPRLATVQAIQLEEAQRDAVSGSAGDTALAAAITVARARRLTAYQEPAGDLERAVADGWQRVLARSAVGRRDNFFELGGDSLSAVRLAKYLTGVLGRQLSAFQIYDHPTVAELAEMVTSGRS